ncbi:MAG: 30S ribosomal protein S8 [Actinobacteria bacterium ATB1]|nr:30S ribosomal protein S8 [Actinobacteria bacterium ATB1]
MIVSDSVADMLTRIRNALIVHHDQVAMPTSKLRVAIAEILQQEGYIDGFEVRSQTDKELHDRNLGGQDLLDIKLRYLDDRERAIQGLKRVSKPGLRVYAKSSKLPRVMGGLGVAIISTSNGVMSDKQARSENVGGEVLCYVW